MADSFQSSDSIRSATPLKHVKSLTLEQPVSLELDGSFFPITIAYETYGSLNAAKDNAVLICHALSGDSHVAKHDDEDDPGWWDIAVGPGKAIDTDKYFVICPNVLGGCRGTTGPNCENPGTKRPYGADFPTITINDIVEVQKRLIDHLTIDRLLAVIGGSMGGHMVLTWAVRFPERVKLAVPIATSSRLTMQALAFDVVGRNAIIRDPNFQNGQYYSDSGPAVGLALARMLGHITYLSPEALKAKFESDRIRPRELSTEFEKRFSVGTYLAYQGDKFVERFDANSYISLSLAMDLFDLGGTREQLAANLARSSCRWLVISYTSDWLFPPEQSQEIVNTLIALGKSVSYCNVTSNCGHDAFLLPDNLAIYGELIRAALTHAHSPGKWPEVHEDDFCADSPTSIFHRHRIDYDRIVEMIPIGATVLDLGCGRGALLERLRARGNRLLMGVEIAEEAVLTCVERGLDVLQSDLNRGLSVFGDAQYDYVVLSQTLQAIKDVEKVIAELLRVGRQCIVSFPNFAYHKLRRILADQGRAPESAGLLRYKWYNTPNIRFFSIADFESFCSERGIQIHQRIALDTESGNDISEDLNSSADMAIFTLSQRRP